MTDLAYTLAEASTVERVGMIGAVWVVIVFIVFVLCALVRWLLVQHKQRTSVKRPARFNPTAHAPPKQREFQPAGCVSQRETGEGCEAMLQEARKLAKDIEEEPSRLEYKVWASVEQYDEANDEYLELDSQEGSVQTFLDEEEAQTLVTRLTVFGQLPEMQQVALLTGQVADVQLLLDMARSMRLKRIGLTPESWYAESGRSLEALITELEHPSGNAAYLDVNLMAAQITRLVHRTPLISDLETELRKYLSKASSYILEPNAL